MELKEKVFSSFRNMESIYQIVFLLAKKEDSESVRKLIESNKAKIKSEEFLGEKLLAYPIKKMKSAFFFSWLISSSAQNIKLIKQQLNFSENILRFLIIKKN